MLSSTTGVFSEPDDFQEAMREYGCKSLVASGHGLFRARLTRVALHRLRLLSADETLERIAFFSVPDDAIFVSVPVGDHLPPIWGGTASHAGEIVALGNGHRLYVQSVPNSRWGIIVIPRKLLETYAQIMIGYAPAPLSGLSRWHPSVRSGRDLALLHTRATRVANARAGVITTSEPATALEQELLEAIIACMSEGPAKYGNDANARHERIMARFEELLQAHPNRALTSTEICTALDVSARTLRKCCSEHLGMGPIPYIRLRRMQLARRALRDADPGTAHVAQIAAQYGFGEAGRFADAYRTRFGELPSVTLRRNAGL
jgi:AraC-like DNA-binding protein